MRLSAELRRTAFEACKFHIVGLMNTWVDIGLFFVMVHLGIAPFGAQAVSYGGGMLNSYCWNKRWTFQGKRLQSRRVGYRFVLWNLVMLGTSSLGLTLLNSHSPLPVFWAKVTITGLMLVLNYGVNRYWVFTENQLDERR